MDGGTPSVPLAGQRHGCVTSQPSLGQGQSNQMSRAKENRNLGVIIENAQEDFAAVVRPGAKSEGAFLHIEGPIGELQLARGSQWERRDVIHVAVAKQHAVCSRHRLVAAYAVGFTKIIPLNSIPSALFPIMTPPFIYPVIIHYWLIMGLCWFDSFHRWLMTFSFQIENQFLRLRVNSEAIGHLLTIPS